MQTQNRFQDSIGPFQGESPKWILLTHGGKLAWQAVKPERSPWGWAARWDTRYSRIPQPNKQQPRLHRRGHEV